MATGGKAEGEEVTRAAIRLFEVALDCERKGGLSVREEGRARQE